MLVLKRLFKIVAGIISLLFLCVYLLLLSSIKEYKKPFTELKVNLALPNTYTSFYKKRFEPDYTTAICLIPDDKNKIISPKLFDGFDALIFVKDSNDKTIYKSYCVFNRSYTFASGKEVYCMYVPNKAFAQGEYHFFLQIKKGVHEELKCTIMALPVYEFLPMIATLSLIFSIIFAFVQIVVVLFFIIRFLIRKYLNQIVPPADK